MDDHVREMVQLLQENPFEAARNEQIKRDYYNQLIQDHKMQSKIRTLEMGEKLRKIQQEKDIFAGRANYLEAMKNIGSQLTQQQEQSYTVDPQSPYSPWAETPESRYLGVPDMGNQGNIDWMAKPLQGSESDPILEQLYQRKKALSLLHPSEAVDLINSVDADIQKYQTTQRDKTSSMLQSTHNSLINKGDYENAKKVFDEMVKLHPQLSNIDYTVNRDKSGGELSLPVNPSTLESVLNTSGLSEDMKNNLRTSVTGEGNLVIKHTKDNGMSVAFSPFEDKKDKPKTKTELFQDVVSPDPAIRANARKVLDAELIFEKEKRKKESDPEDAQEEARQIAFGEKSIKTVKFSDRQHIQAMAKKINPEYNQARFEQKIKSVDGVVFNVRYSGMRNLLSPEGPLSQMENLYKKINQSSPKVANMLTRHAMLQLNNEDRAELELLNKVVGEETSRILASGRGGIEMIRFGENLINPDYSVNVNLRNAQALKRSIAAWMATMTSKTPLQDEAFDIIKDAGFDPYKMGNVKNKPRLDSESPKETDKSSTENSLEDEFMQGIQGLK